MALLPRAFKGSFVAAFEAGNEALGLERCKVPRFKASMLAEFQVSKCQLAEMKVSQRVTVIPFTIESTLLKAQECGLCGLFRPDLVPKANDKSFWWQG